MAVIFPGRFIYFQSPRTGSNAIKYAMIGTYRKGPPVADFIQHGGHTTRADLIKFQPIHACLPGVCNIRNPFDVIAAWFSHMIKYESITEMLGHQTNKTFIKNGLIHYHVPECEFLIRHSSDMLPRLNDILNHFRMRTVKEIPINNAPDTPRPPYQTVYTKEDKQLVWDMFGKEIKDLNYDWEEL